MPSCTNEIKRSNQNTRATEKLCALKKLCANDQIKNAFSWTLDICTGAFAMGKAEQPMSFALGPSKITEMLAQLTRGAKL